MIDLPTFLIRWFFIGNLIRDAAEIQTLPYTPNTPHQADLPRQIQQEQPHSPYASPIEHVHADPLPSNLPSSSQQEQYIPQHQPAQLAPQTPPIYSEEEWRGHCLRGILSYPPGTRRLLVMDAMRLELVQQLSQYFSYVDSALHRIRKFGRRDDVNQNKESSTGINAIESSNVEIIEKENIDPAIRLVSNDDATSDHELATNLIDARHNYHDGPPISQAEIEHNKRSLKQIREYLPQLVSAVLKSPHPFDPNLVDPVQKLRERIIARCQADPSWGIELCWLLEAEVGRAWKSLFEHRQETGKRLIIVLPADKAAVLAQIGPKKREAFDLLQDVEKVTAYGYHSDHEPWHDKGSTSPEWSGLKSRLPSSVSLLRCSHFGDTMHFIDRLTKISNDLRMVPAIHRHNYLHDSLYEMNRRLRRRMATRGEISLDVEDHLGPYGWPEMKDLTLDMLKHSVHLPLVPNQGVWPSGSTSESDDQAQSGVVRVLNIVVPESRLLASRERCPFLVRVEVAETSFDGSDARLYATGAPRLGVTVGEALCSSTPATGNVAERSEQIHDTCSIPFELTSNGVQNGSASVANANNTNSIVASNNFPRGGLQIEMDSTDFMDSNPYDAVRQQEYEQLHQQIQDTQTPSAPLQAQYVERPSVSTGEALLNRVFGQPWKDVCDEVQKTSPYGHVKGWRLASFILKAGEDIRREALVMQMISKFREWFEEEIPEQNRPYLRPYTIMCVGGDAGLLECLTDAKSVDEVKKTCDGFLSLRDYFERAYGAPLPMGHTHPQPIAGAHDGLTFEEAQDNFLRSLVGYSLVCYVLQIKDRHNANILMDREGHIMHIDFGFVLGDTPRMGKVPIFSERAPFKLSGEFWEVLGGWNPSRGGLGVRFCKMFEEAFACASTHKEELASLVEGIMLTLNDNPAEAKRNAHRVCSRLTMRGPPNSQEQKQFIMDLVNTALTSWGTSTYDWLQKNMNGYQ